MARELSDALAEVRAALLDAETLVRAVASGRRRGGVPPWRRAELRYVDLKAGRRLQTTSYDDTQAHTANHADPAAAVDALLAEPFGNWHVETTTSTLQLRVTKKGEALLHSKARPSEVALPRAHDRAKQRLLPEDDPVLVALGISDAQGRAKPSRQAKYRQVEELVRALDATLTDAWESGRLRRPTAGDPLRVVDLGCGNAYLTFAAHAYLARVRGLPVRVIGVDVKEQSRRHNEEVAARLGVQDQVVFVVGGIADARVESPDVVLALHACDTATDDALARAIGWEAPVVLAAPCCHHDVAAQLRRRQPEGGEALLTRDGILRERLADTLTDALRAGLMRGRGYRVDVVEFVESRHTPRNTLLRAVRTGDAHAPTAERAATEARALADTWGLTPRLEVLLAGDRS